MVDGPVFFSLASGAPSSPFDPRDELHTSEVLLHPSVEEKSEESAAGGDRPSSSSHASSGGADDGSSGDTLGGGDGDGGSDEVDAGSDDGDFAGDADGLAAFDALRTTSAGREAIPMLSSSTLAQLLTVSPQMCPPDIEVSIDSTEKQSKGKEKFTAYNITVGSGRRYWTVSRRYRQFLALHNALAAKGDVGGSMLPAFPPKKIFGSMAPEVVEERRILLQSYLRQLVVSPFAWQYPEFVSFLDNRSRWLGMQVRYQQLLEHVAHLEEVCRGAHEEVQRLVDGRREQQSVIEMLSQQVQRLRGERKAAALHGEHATSVERLLSDEHDDFVESVVEKSLSDEFDRLAVHSEPIHISSPLYFGSPAATSVDGAMGSHTRSTPLFGSLLSPPRPTPPDPVKKDGVWGMPGLFSSPTRVATSTEVPRNIEPSAVDIRLQQLLHCFQPCDRAEQRRFAAFSFVCRLVKKALGAQAFAVGACPLQLYLPDDELRLSAFLCQGQEKDWFVKVMKLLCIAAGEADVPSGEDGAEASEPEATVGTVSFIARRPKRIKCIVNGINVDITANQFSDLCETAFLEEVDRCVGNGHLFKRSLLLLHAWFRYESRSFSGERWTIDAYTLAVLVVHIFNVHFESIHHPFQALALFFATYGKFDWERNSATIDGPLPVSSLCAPSEHRLGGTSRPLLSLDVLDKYRELYRRKRRKHDIETPIVEEGGRGAFFVIRYVNIVDPLDSRHNLGAALSRKDGKRLKQRLEMGLSSFQPLLSRLASIAGDGDRTVLSLVDGLFQHTWRRFGNGWRPDVPAKAGGALLAAGAAAADAAVDSLSSNYDALWTSIEYCSLLLDSEVTVPALMSLSIDILTERGPLPVGEIGKMLQGATSNAGLSATLKDKFGGLKKFLEKYPENFLLSRDHPYNPHVYLRKALSDEQVEAIMGGATLLPSTKRKVRTRRKKHGGGGGGARAERAVSGPGYSGGGGSSIGTAGGRSVSSSASGRRSRGGKSHRGRRGGGGGGRRSFNPSAKPFVPGGLS
eukprot:PLAT3971.1.p1 GENE.PLAT3971.1~~PLAT3971.1.p1  ORF type:complete len:1126 (-),score=393.47 PLAT3971.1:72-3143(-)